METEFGIDINPTLERRRVYQDLSQDESVFALIATRAYEHKAVRGNITKSTDMAPALRHEIAHEAVDRIKWHSPPFQTPYSEDYGKIRIFADHLKDVSAARGTKDPVEIALIDARMEGRRSVLDHIGMHDFPILDGLKILQNIVDELTSVGTPPQSRK